MFYLLVLSITSFCNHLLYHETPVKGCEESLKDHDISWRLPGVVMVQLKKKDFA